jgi:hypothetical protein
VDNPGAQGSGRFPGIHSHTVRASADAAPSENAAVTSKVAGTAALRMRIAASAPRLR